MFAYKEGGSAISIGRNCRFMNWQFGNLIGLNHKCIVATQSDEAKLTIGDKFRSRVLVCGVLIVLR